jgi:hypothetical protein
MSEHLTEGEIYELAVGDDPSESAAAHVEGCASCIAAVAATRRLLDDVETLPPSVPVPEGVGDRLARRLATSTESRRRRRDASGPMYWVVRIAAAAIFFAAGALTHASWTSDDIGPAAASLSPALQVQAAGTGYVAAMARLVADSSEISPGEMRMAREVGLAALYGAAFELTRLPIESGATSEIEYLARQAWTGEPGKMDR